VLLLLLILSLESRHNARPPGVPLPDAAHSIGKGSGIVGELGGEARRIVIIGAGLVGDVVLVLVLIWILVVVVVAVIIIVGIGIVIGGRKSLPPPIQFIIPTLPTKLPPHALPASATSGP